MFRNYLLSIALFMAPFMVYAQADAQAAQQNQKVAQAALEVASLVDHNKAGEVWDGASSIAKQLVTHDAFIAQIAADRQVVGAVISRNVTNVSYRQSDGKQIPQGIYANVAFSTQFANVKQAVRELVSFHLDNDHVWRVSGYTLRNDVRR